MKNKIVLIILVIFLLFGISSCESAQITESQVAISALEGNLLMVMIFLKQRC